MTDTLALWQQVADGFGERLAAVGPDGWERHTPCDEWTVSQLVEHAVGAQRMVPRAMGATGGIDTEGTDLVEVWAAVRAAAEATYTAPGALDAVVSLPFGEMPARDGLRFPLGDLLIHTWDLARAVGADDRLSTDACAYTLEGLQPLDEMLRSPGFFGPKFEPAADADVQGRLLAFVGRQV
jgi:uncharacterized protein (TIGR03086 family)